MTAEQRLAALLARCTAIVAFTGAGVSTESGIPDFRSPGGVWSRFDPREFTFDRYVAAAQTRERAWAMRREFWAAAPQPNPAHHAIAALEAAGRLRGVVTQNIDGLHQAAGSRTVVEIHGTARDVACIGAEPRGGVPAGCGFRAPVAWAFGLIDAGATDPRCPDCSGLVKSATISFGQAMDPESLRRAEELVAGADCLLTVGSSLQVYPAAGLPALARELGATVAIVNDEATPLDDLAGVVVRGRAGEVLPRVVRAALDPPRTHAEDDAGANKR